MMTTHKSNSGDHEDTDRDEEESRNHEESRASSGRKISRDDLQDLAKVGSDLLKKTIVSGFDIFKEVSKEIPKEAQQFISARKEQVLQNMTKDIAQVMLTNAMEKFFTLIREHRLEVSFRIVRDKSTKQSDETGKAESAQGLKDSRQGQKVSKSKGHSLPFRNKNKKFRSSKGE